MSSLTTHFSKFVLVTVAGAHSRPCLRSESGVRDAAKRHRGSIMWAKQYWIWYDDPVCIWCNRFWISPDAYTSIWIYGATSNTGVPKSTTCCYQPLHQFCFGGQHLYLIGACANFLLPWPWWLSSHLINKTCPSLSLHESSMQARNKVFKYLEQLICKISWPHISILPYISRKSGDVHDGPSWSVDAKMGETTLKLKYTNDIIIETANFNK